MKYLKYISLMLLLFLLQGTVVSCSEESGTEDEFVNWEQRNKAQIAAWAANSSLRKILTYTKNENGTVTASDYIYVEELESGPNTEHPLYTDTVRVGYRTRLIPTTNYPDGLVIDENYAGTFDWEKTGASDFTCAALTDGFATAVMNMNIDDYWRVYVPYTLAYGTSSGTNRPAYSNLVFDIALIDYWSAQEKRPPFKSR